MPEPPLSLSAAVGAYPHTQALKAGRIASDRLKLEFRRDLADQPRLRARWSASGASTSARWRSRPSCRPRPTAARLRCCRSRWRRASRKSALLCRADSDIRGPADLAGRRVGVRAYSQTTGLWLRGLLADDYGVQPERHALDHLRGRACARICRSRPSSSALPPGKDMLTMLRERRARRGHRRQRRSRRSAVAHRLSRSRRRRRRRSGPSTASCRSTI